MQYQYRDDAGYTIDRDFPMGTAPETVTHGAVVFRRVFTAPAMIIRDGGGVKHVGRALPTSKSLPRDNRKGEIVTEHGRSLVKLPDGTLRTLRGERVIRNNEDARKHAADAGCERLS